MHLPDGARLDTGPGGLGQIVVAKTGSASTVVWNPWIDKARALADFGDEEWTGRVCVETANVLDDALALAPGASHVLAATMGRSRAGAWRA